MIRADSVTKRYQQGAVEVTVLREVSIQIPRGQFVSIMGPSGSGKSTLLNLLGALDRPTSGEVWIDGQGIQRMSDDERTLLRRDRLGFIFQFFNLLPTLTALENVCLPALLAGRSLRELRGKGVELLDRVGLGDRTEHRPVELSGGEMQRVAVARALISDPPVLLADEPTGNLDSKTGDEILRLLRQTSRDLARTIVMVTHDPKAARYGDAVIELKDGEIVEQRLVE